MAYILREHHKNQIFDQREEFHSILYSRKKKINVSMTARVKIEILLRKTKKL